MTVCPAWSGQSKLQEKLKNRLVFMCRGPVECCLASPVLFESIGAVYQQ